ncbi:MAG: helix-turn-helix protein [Mucilaginibacter sp.]|nr:helix-turn-helix protein [Mucilaginibacter sp.]
MKSPNISEEYLLLRRIEIGARLRALRLERGLTGEQVGDITGLSKNHISRIESGKYNFNFDTLVLLSVALNFDIELILK